MSERDLLMRARATFTTLTPAPGQDTATHLVLSLLGETPPTQGRKALIVVVDASSSMLNDNKLDTVKASLRHLSTLLGDQDRLGLVSFAEHATVHIAPTAAKPSTRQLAVALAGVNAYGNTNLSAGLDAAANCVSGLDPDVAVRIVVLTDGLANRGMRTAQQLKTLVARYEQRASLSFLGVGTDCDHALLSALATAGCGSYGFVEHGMDAAAVLGAEVGGFLSAEVWNLAVTLTAHDRWLSVDSDHPLGMVRAADGGPARVGTLMDEATRHLVWPVTVHGPRRPHGRPVTCVEVHLRGTTASGDIDLTLRPKVHFGGPAGDVDAQLVEVVELAVVAEAARTADELSAAGDRVGAVAAMSSLSLTSSLGRGVSGAYAGLYAGLDHAAAVPLTQSYGAAISGNLAGSSTAFNSAGQSLLGSYTTRAQRSAAASTQQATTPNTASPPEDSDATAAGHDQEGQS